MVGGLPAIGVSNKWIWYSTLVYHMKNKGLPKMIYKHEIQDKAKVKDAAPKVFNEPTEIEDKNTLEDDSEGSESSEGYSVCGFIIE